MAKPDWKTLGPDRDGFGAALLAWYRVRARPLPWRERPSLYRTVVSEFMLQQTQVKAVLPYFARWTEKWPDFASLAAASEAEVLKLWEGLGYYSRARRLRQLARDLSARAAPPRTAAEWIELPGIGPYTAAAIASIAGGERVACVDGNVVRILARLTADGTEFRDGSAALRAFAGLAQELVPEQEPGNHNQAMMELGATVCLRAEPRCGSCPVRRYCAGAARGNPAALPRFAPKKIERVSVARAWCERRGSLLLHRVDPAAARLAGLHELPTAAQAGLPPRAGRLLARRRRSITRFRIVESIFAWPAPRGPLAPGLEWVPLARLDAVALSGPHRRWIGEILEGRRPSGPLPPAGEG